MFPQNSVQNQSKIEKYHLNHSVCVLREAKQQNQRGKNPSEVTMLDSYESSLVIDRNRRNSRT